MKRILAPFAIFFAAVIMCSSCLNSDEEEYVYYDDTAITAFSLGTLNRYLHTTSSEGTDSIYKTTLAGSSYKFYIDQITREIYNPDSLPVGTDAEHVICTVTAKNSGVVTIQNVANDSLKYFDSTDSIDFTVPRVFRVYANSGEAYRDYTIRVNVHQEDGEAFNWQSMNTTAIMAGDEVKKAVAVNDRLFLFTYDGYYTHLYAYHDDGWSQSNAVLDANLWKNVVKKGERIFMLNGKELLSFNGMDIALVSTGAALKQLVAASSKKLYAVSEDGSLVASADDGATWTAQAADTDMSCFPTENISFAVLPIATDDSAERIVVTGTRSLADYPGDANATVWGLIEEEGMQHAWTYYDVTTDNLFPLQRLSHLQMTGYGRNMLALGGNGEGACTADGFVTFYQSSDSGITWKSTSKISLPEGFDTSDNAFALCADSSSHLWLIQGSRVWRGRLNKMAWDTIQTAFTE